MDSIKSSVAIIPGGGIGGLHIGMKLGEAARLFGAPYKVSEPHGDCSPRSEFFDLGFELTVVYSTEDLVRCIHCYPDADRPGPVLLDLPIFSTHIMTLRQRCIEEFEDVKVRYSYVEIPSLGLSIFCETLAYYFQDRKPAGFMPELDGRVTSIMLSAPEKKVEGSVSASINGEKKSVTRPNTPDKAPRLPLRWDITPDVGCGPLKFGMSYKEVVSILGVPDDAEEPTYVPPDIRERYPAYRWKETDLQKNGFGSEFSVIARFTHDTGKFHRIELHVDMLSYLWFSVSYKGFVINEHDGAQALRFLTDSYRIPSEGYRRYTSIPSLKIGFISQSEPSAPSDYDPIKSEEDFIAKYYPNKQWLSRMETYNILEVIVWGDR